MNSSKSKPRMRPRIGEVMVKYSAGFEVEPPELIPTKKMDSEKKCRDIRLEKYAHLLWGVNVMVTPRMSKGGMLTLIEELGHNFTGKFDTERQFCRRLNLVPNNKISGSKTLSGKIPRRGMLPYRLSDNAPMPSKIPRNWWAITSEEAKVAEAIYMQLCARHIK